MNMFKLAGIVGLILNIAYADGGKKSIIDGLEIGVEYAITTDVLDKGESVTNNNPGHNGAFVIEYKGLAFENSSRTISSGIELGTSLRYTHEFLDNTEVHGFYKLISESGEKYVSDAGAEVSIGFSTNIVESFEFGLDYIYDVKYKESDLVEFAIGNEISNLGIEFLLGRFNDKTEINDDFTFYKLSLNYPCVVTTGEWGLVATNTNKNENNVLYSLAHKFSF